MLFAVILLITVTAFSHHSWAAENLVVNITANSVSKGDFFVIRNERDEFFVKAADFPAIGIQLPAGLGIDMAGEGYVPLKTLSGLSVTFDEEKLSLILVAPVKLLPKTIMDMSSASPSREGVYSPKENSAFLNYAINYIYNNPDGFQSFTLVDKLGLRSGEFFFITDSQYTKTESSSDFIRLMSSLTYERPKDLQWITFGDMFASSGNLGSTINIGGIGISKAYQMDPYLIRQPTLNLTGTAALPSQVDIYVDGVLTGRERVSPGQFQMSNLNYYGGSRNVELVVRDAFGNEQRFHYPAYFTSDLLKQGLHDYSYNFGLLRQQYGVQSNVYSKPAFSVFHRYGVTDYWTIGARGEAADDIYNGGIQTSYLIPQAGVVTLDFAGSSASFGTGWAMSFSHSYQKGRFGSNLLFTKYTEDYATIDSSLLTEKFNYVAGCGVSYTTENWGAISLGYSEQNTYNAGSRQVASASYTYNLTKSLTLGITTQAVRDATPGTDYQILVSLNFYSPKNIQVSAQYQATRDGNTETVQVIKYQPTGEGWGYNALLTKNVSSSSGTTELFNPHVQYNGPYGTYTLDSYFQRGDISSDSYNLGAAGALVYTEGFFGLTRPVNDSFSFVMVDKLPGVAVNVNNEEIGKTDSSGRIIIPTMRSYNVNQINFEANNVPMDYNISGVNTNVLPSLWSGSCINFDVTKVQAVTGFIFVSQKGKIIPLEFYEVTMIVNGKEFKFPTGRGGEFYFETTKNSISKNASLQQQGCKATKEKAITSDKISIPGTYQSSFEYEGKTYPFKIVIPSSSDAIIDIGKIVCEIK